MSSLPTIPGGTGGNTGLGTIGQGIDIISGLQGILGLGGSASGATDYEDSIDPEGMKYLLRIALEGNQGLAAVSGAEQEIGLYNSTVNSMLVNDLLARSAGEVAARNSSRNYKGGKPNVGGTLGGIAGGILGSAGGPLGSILGSGIGSSIGNAIGGLF